MLCETEGYDVIVPMIDDGHIEPIFAVYRRSVINHIRDILYGSKNRRIRALFDRVNTKVYQNEKFQMLQKYQY
jgi:molybdopterin-guanine dinucleotide biosynthesis protein A